MQFLPRELSAAGLAVSEDGRRRSALDVLALPGGGFSRLEDLGADVSGIAEDVREQLSIEAMYQHYVDRQARDAEALRRDEQTPFPDDIDFTALKGLSNELRDKLIRAQPATLAQAARIEGMTPAALTVLIAHLRKRARKIA